MAAVESMTIGTLARTAGVNVETVRFYERKRLLAQPSKPYGGVRRYDGAALARLRFIKTAQALGFTLEEVAGLLRLEDGDHCDEARVAAQEKLACVRAKLRDLRRIECALAGLVRACGAAGGELRCPLIASLERGGA